MHRNSGERLTETDKTVKIRKRISRMPQDDSLAQLVEHNTFNVGVLGSSPRRITEGFIKPKQTSEIY